MKRVSNIIKLQGKQWFRITTYINYNSTARIHNNSEYNSSLTKYINQLIHTIYLLNNKKYKIMPKKIPTIIYNLKLPLFKNISE